MEFTRCRVRCTCLATLLQTLVLFPWKPLRHIFMITLWKCCLAQLFTVEITFNRNYSSKTGEQAVLRKESFSRLSHMLTWGSLYSVWKHWKVDTFCLQQVLFPVIKTTVALGTDWVFLSYLQCCAFFSPLLCIACLYCLAVGWASVWDQHHFLVMYLDYEK